MDELEIPPEVIADGAKFHDWQHRFVRAYDELVHGNCDIHDIADSAYRIYPKYRGRDPVEVARELQAARRPW